MKKNYGKIERLLKIEQGAKNIYDDYLKKIQEEYFLREVKRVRDQEIEHITLVKKLIAIMRLSGDFAKEKTANKKNAITGNYQKLINSAAGELKVQIKLISLLEELDLFNNRLKEMNTLKSEFFSTVSHQMRSPLTEMKWFFELLLAGDIGKLSKKQRDYMRDIYSANQKLISLVNDLLKTSRLEEVRSIKNQQTIDLIKFLKSILSRYQTSLNLKRIKVVSRGNKESIWATSQPDLLENVIDNIISNAVKYTPESGEIRIYCRQSGKDFLLKVADNGIGISRETAGRIFEKFFRAENARIADKNGTGLGLFIAAESAKKLGGKIWFEPNQPKGTIFYFQMPADHKLNHKTYEKLRRS